MFGRKKATAAGSNYIIAVKDYEKTTKAIKDGSLHVPFDKEIYSKLFENEVAKVNDIKGLGKFIRTTKKDKKEVVNYWEGLIVEGYALVEVRYDETTPSINKLCNNDSIKFVCPA